MADRWAKADCLRDVFEMLAREIPLIDRPNNPPVRLTASTMERIEAHLPQVEALVVHRPVLRMIKEMISENFPRSAQACRPPSVAGMLDPSADTLADLNSQMELQQPGENFQMPFSLQLPFGDQGTNSMENTDDYGLLSFPGVFDLDAWT
jgi:hypothetical protein